MASTRMEVRIADLPDVLWQLRREMAAILRREAGAESDPRVARRLREVADLFEAGVTRRTRGGA